MSTWTTHATVIVLVVATAACGRAEQRAAEARADSLQAALQRQRDSLSQAATETRLTDSLQAALQRQRDSLSQAAAETRLADSLKAARMRAVSDSIRAVRSRPRDLVLINTTGLTISPQRYADYAFVLDSAIVDCAVRGRVEVLEGGTSKDVEVFLFTADDLTNWRNNHSVKPIFQSGRQTVTTLDAAVTKGGEYHLVVSNYFAFISRKTVKSEVTATCRGLQPRLK